MSCDHDGETMSCDFDKRSRCSVFHSFSLAFNSTRIFAIFRRNSQTGCFSSFAVIAIGRIEQYAIINQFEHADCSGRRETTDFLSVRILLQHSNFQDPLLLASPFDFVQLAKTKHIVGMLRHLQSLANSKYCTWVNATEHTFPKQDYCLLVQSIRFVEFRSFPDQQPHPNFQQPQA
jgi:hypothetical protein